MGRKKVAKKNLKEVGLTPDPPVTMPDDDTLVFPVDVTPTAKSPLDQAPKIPPAPPEPPLDGPEVPLQQSPVDPENQVGATDPPVHCIIGILFRGPQLRARVLHSPVPCAVTLSCTICPPSHLLMPN